MDPLTHSLTGLAMSRAGLKRVLPQATWIVVLAANVPDVDVVTAAGGQESYLHYHRHLTHALLLMPVMALLPVLVVGFLTKKPFHPRRAYLVSLAGVASHPLLDWTNVYGIRLLLPFSSEWLRLDMTHLFDIWIWAILLLAVAAPALSSLVTSEIGGKASQGRGFAIFALFAVLMYEGARFVLHRRAVEILESRLYNGAEPLRVAAIPGPLNPFRWRGLIDAGRFYALADVDLMREFDPATAQIFFKLQPGPRADALRAVAHKTEAFRTFETFVQFPYWIVTPVDNPEGGFRVQLTDLRFGTPASPRFIATALIRSDMSVSRSWFSYGPLSQPR